MKDAKLQEHRAHCKKCDTDITIKLPVNVPVRLFTTWLKFVDCSECGAGCKYVML